MDCVPAGVPGDLDKAKTKKAWLCRSNVDFDIFQPAVNG